MEVELFGYVVLHINSHGCEAVEMRASDLELRNRARFFRCALPHLEL
jgi:hypothetical protein